MKTQEGLAQHFGLMYQTAAANLDGLTQEQSLMHPSQGAFPERSSTRPTTSGSSPYRGESPGWRARSRGRVRCGRSERADRFHFGPGGIPIRNLEMDGLARAVLVAPHPASVGGHDPSAQGDLQPGASSLAPRTA